MLFMNQTGLLYLLKDVFRGQSLGKYIMGIAISKARNEHLPPSVRQVVVRNLLLFWMPFELGVWLTRRGKGRLGDQATKTWVIAKAGNLKIRIGALVGLVLVGVLLFVGIVSSALGLGEARAIAIATVVSAPDLQKVLGDDLQVQEFASPSVLMTHGNGTASFFLTATGTKGKTNVTVLLVRAPGEPWRALIRESGQKENLTDALYFNQQGIDAFLRQNYDEAIRLHGQAITISPRFAWAYHNRGLAHGQKGDFKAAVGDYTKAIFLDRQYARAYVNRGAAYIQLGNFPAALNDLNAAIAIEPKYAIAYRDRGFLLTQQFQKYPEALKDFDFAALINPSDPRTFFGRGMTYARLGDRAAALSDFQVTAELAQRLGLSAAYAEAQAQMAQLAP
jgi:Flp pilus assembly protein TadD